LIGIYPALRLVFRGRAWIANAYIRYLVLVAAGCLMLAPFAWLVCAAFKDKDVLMQYIFLPPMSEWSPKTLNLDNFRQLFSGEESLEGKVYFWEYLANSLFLSSVATVVQLFFCSMGGYALAKFDFRGKRFIMAFMIGSLMIPGILFLAPVFQLIYKLGWMDTYLALIVPGAAGVFGIFLFRQAIVRLPNSLIEAARIDGAGEFSIYLKVIMPMVRPMTGAFCLVSFLGSWNAFIAPQIYIQSLSKLTLPVVLNQYVSVYQQQYGVFLAGTLLAIIPPAILFFALQKEFISGLTSGAVKG
jgi:ABC-type glycerol-3-phosphate transport system permease component